MLGLCCSLCLVLSMFLATSVDSMSSPSSSKAFIAVSANDTLLIQPPQGGFVSIVNFTELSLTKSDLSSTLVRVMSTETELSTSKSGLSSTKSELSSALVRVTSTESKLNSTQSDLSSALVRVNRTEELLFSVLGRISTLESSTTITAQSPCK